MAERQCSEHDEDDDFSVFLACWECKSTGESLHHLPCGHSYCIQCLLQHIQATVSLPSESTNVVDSATHCTCPKCNSAFYWDGEKAMPRSVPLRRPQLSSPIQEQASDGVAPVLYASTGGLRENRCQIHNNRPLDYHCASCMLSICEVCVRNQHGSHCVKSAEETLRTKRDDLRKNIVDIDSRLKQGSAAFASMTASLERLKSTKSEAEESIRRHVRHVHEAFEHNLNQKQVELLNQLNHKYEHVFQALTKQKRDMEKYVNRLQNANDFANDLLGNESLEELIELQRRIGDVIEDLAKKKPRPLKPVHYGKLHFYAKDPHFTECFKSFGYVDCDPLIGSLFTSSLILREEPDQFAETMEEWMKDLCKWRLCYRASRDGWSAEKFHECCDRVGPTVCLIKVGAYIFGGYTDESWEATNWHKKSTKSFLFSLRNRDKLQPFKAPVSEENNAILCHKNYGLAFGYGCDLYIANNANANKQSYTKFGYSYKAPDGYSNYARGKNQGLLAGEYYFTPSEIEVFY